MLWKIISNLFMKHSVYGNLRFDKHNLMSFIAISRRERDKNGYIKKYVFWNWTWEIQQKTVVVYVLSILRTVQISHREEIMVQLNTSRMRYKNMHKDYKIGLYWGPPLKLIGIFWGNNKGCKYSILCQNLGKLKYSTITNIDCGYGES